MQRQENRNQTFFASVTNAAKTGVKLGGLSISGLFIGMGLTIEVIGYILSLTEETPLFWNQPVIRHTSFLICLAEAAAGGVVAAIAGGISGAIIGGLTHDNNERLAHATTP